MLNLFYLFIISKTHNCLIKENNLLIIVNNIKGNHITVKCIVIFMMVALSLNFTLVKIKIYIYLKLKLSFISE